MQRLIGFNVIVCVILSLLIIPTLQQGESLFFYMSPGVFEAPLVSEMNWMYPLFEFNHDPVNVDVGAYTILPGLNQSSYFVAICFVTGWSNQTNYFFSYDMSTGAKSYVPLQNDFDSLAAHSPLRGAIPDPTNQEVLFVLQTRHYTNLTWFNPTTGSYRYVNIDIMNIYPLSDISIQLDLNAQIVYAQLSELQENPNTVIAYDAKSGDLLNSYVVDIENGQQLVSVLVDQQTGSLYGIVGSNANTTTIVSIDVIGNTTDTVATIPGKFYSYIWMFNSDYSLFYATFGGQVWTVTFSGQVQSLRNIPGDASFCTRNMWAIGPSTMQQQPPQEQNEPEFYYVFNEAHTDANNDFVYAVQLLSHTIGNTTASLVDVVTAEDLIHGYAIFTEMYCYPATMDFFISLVIGPNAYSDGNIVNLVSYDTNQVIKQFEVGLLDSYSAWNNKTNTLVLSHTVMDIFNNSGSTTFLELDVSSSSDPSPQPKFTLPNVFYWHFDSASQSIFAINFYSASTLFSFQYPSGNINWQLEFNNNTYSVYPKYIAVDSSNKRIYILTCNEVDSMCFNTGEQSIVEIEYSPTSAVLVSSTPIGEFNSDNFVEAIYFSPSLGAVVIATYYQLLVYSPATNQTTNVAPFAPSCASCYILRDV